MQINQCYVYSAVGINHKTQNGYLSITVDNALYKMLSDFINKHLK